MDGPLQPEFVTDFGARFLAAWNAHDAGAVAALCTEDVVFADPALAAPARGRDAVRDYVEGASRAFPDFELRLVGELMAAREEPMVLCRFEMTGTMLGDWERSGIAATGARIQLPGVDEWHFRDGMVARYATYYDSIAMARQLGVLPPAGSLMERSMARLQHVQARVQRRAAARARSAGRAATRAAG